MKLYKNLLFVSALTLTFACSEDNLEQQPTSSTTVEDFRIPKPEYDNSNLGVYKGLFTTTEGDIQGEVLISLDKNREGIAELKLSSGELIELKSSILAEGIEVNELSFISNDDNNATSFRFSVDSDGKNSNVTDVNFDNKQASIITAKDMLRAPANPVMGTYTCTNCNDVYPGFSNSAHTFSLLISGDDSNITIATSIVYAGNEYVSTNNVMSDCNADGMSGTCMLSGNPVVMGYGLDYSGSYQYQLTDVLPDCSFVTGTWSMDIGPAVLEGTFISNNTSPCP